ncbi:MAG: stage II sporulation protein M [Lachnospiraceae bacterium]|nr:stage II sporulation protein M [Lachnospiraceae bacterium]
MRRMTGKHVQKEPVVKILVLFLCGAVLGILFAHLVRIWSGEKHLVNEAYLECLLTEQIAVPDLYFYTVWEHLKELILFFLLQMTWLSFPCAIFYLLRQGFLFGFLFAVLFQAYRLKGGILTLAYYLPQCLIQIPLWMFCYYMAWQIWLERKKNRESEVTDYTKLESSKLSLHKINMLHLDGKSVILLLGMCLIAGALEVLPGNWLLRRVVDWLL